MLARLSNHRIDSLIPAKCKEKDRMAKLRDKPINKEDILEYLKESSDFAFEISVLRKLVSLGFSCEHAGTYEDPITKKTREFDIRARKLLIDEPDFKVNVSLSVECKNLRDNFPLVIHCMPRKKTECYLDLIWASEPANYIPPYEKAMRVPLEVNEAPYEYRMAVGKSCDQVGRRASQAAEIIGNDSDVFEKISQAINASYDLISESHYAADKGIDVVSLVIPVFVVPDDRLWTVWYKKTGEIEREPTNEINVEYYLDKSWLVGSSSNELQRRYYLSHLEIIQVQGVADLINKYAQLPSLSSRSHLDTVKFRAVERRP